jgi:hypothetical protein
MLGPVQLRNRRVRYLGNASTMVRVSVFKTLIRPSDGSPVRR